MGYVTGRWVWREESGLGREEEEEKKKKKRKKRDGLKDETGHSKWGHHVNIFTEMPLKTEL